MQQPKNFLFVMCDHLRWDFLSCYGHRVLRTPNIDWLAQNGVRFSHAFAQSSDTAASRASIYTGRTAFSHGVTGASIPVPLSEWTLGDYVRDVMRAAIIGRTDLATDRASLERIGLKQHQTRLNGIPESQNSAGFEPYEFASRRNGGGATQGGESEPEGYNAWLRSVGYPSDSPSRDYAQVTVGPDGELMDGAELRNAGFPARIREGHSETAFLTDRALDFIREAEDDRWFLHLSYSKPDAPFVVPAPFHTLYAEEKVRPAKRSLSERTDQHPVFAALSETETDAPLLEDEVRAIVMPTYMGLVRQLDYHLGRVFTFLRERDLLTQTMIVFTSNHGINLGDHWLGGHELFHDTSIRIPLIVLDPSEAGRAGRRRVEHRPVEAIDLVPTFLEALNLPLPQHRLEGRSLLPLIRGESTTDWSMVIGSEIDFSTQPVCSNLGLPARDARAFMLRTPKWKYIHYLGYRPQLFDLENDPDEFRDLGAEPGHSEVRSELHQALLERLLRRRGSVTSMAHH